MTTHPLLQTERTLDDLAAEFEAAKAVEAGAREARIAAEQAIIDLIGVKEEGAQTVSGDRYKVTTKGVLKRKLDMDKFDLVKDQFPEKLLPLKVVTSLDATKARYIENNETELAALMAQCMTAEPGKPAVTVKFIEN